MRTNEEQLRVDIGALEMRIEQLERAEVGIREDVAELRSTVAEIDTPEIRGFIQSQIRSRENFRAVGEAAARGAGVTSALPRRYVEAPPEYPASIKTRGDQIEHEEMLLGGGKEARELGKKLRAARLEREKAGIE